MLDRSQPHDQVFGIPGVSWSQAGHLYDGAGNCVTYRRENTGEVDGIGDPVFRTIVERVEEVAPPPVVERVSVGADDEYTHMHWKTLKVILDQYGEPFTTREAAIAFLRGRA